MGGGSNLRAAAATGDIEVMKQAIESGDRVDDVSPIEPRDAPIHTASRSGHLEAVQFLISQGADPEMLGGRGAFETPVFLCAESGQLDVLKHLVQNCGCSGATPDEEGFTPIHVAAEKGHIDIVKFLVSEGFDFEQPNDEGVTPLSSACREGRIEVVEFLILHKCSLDSADKEGFTPLCYACQEGQVHIVQRLIRAGCDLTVTDNDGNTALMLAAHGGYVEVVEYLVKKECPLNETNDEGLTALGIACREGHADVARFLQTVMADEGAIRVAYQHGFIKLAQELAANNMEKLKKAHQVPGSAPRNESPKSSVLTPSLTRATTIQNSVKQQNHTPKVEDRRGVNEDIATNACTRPRAMRSTPTSDLTHVKTQPRWTNDTTNNKAGGGVARKLWPRTQHKAVAGSPNMLRRQQSTPMTEQHNGNVKDSIANRRTRIVPNIKNAKPFERAATDLTPVSRQHSAMSNSPSESEEPAPITSPSIRRRTRADMENFRLRAALSSPRSMSDVPTNGTYVRSPPTSPARTPLSPKHSPLSPKRSPTRRQSSPKSRALSPQSPPSPKPSPSSPRRQQLALRNGASTQGSPAHRRPPLRSSRSLGRSAGKNVQEELKRQSLTEIKSPRLNLAKLSNSGVGVKRSSVSRLRESVRSSPKHSGSSFTDTSVTSPPRPAPEASVRATMHRVVPPSLSLRDKDTIGSPRSVTSPRAATSPRSIISPRVSSPRSSVTSPRVGQSKNVSSPRSAFGRSTSPRTSSPRQITSPRLRENGTAPKTSSSRSLSSKIRSKIGTVANSPRRFGASRLSNSTPWTPRLVRHKTDGALSCISHGGSSDLPSPSFSKKSASEPPKSALKSGNASTTGKSRGSVTFDADPEDEVVPPSHKKKSGSSRVVMKRVGVGRKVGARFAAKQGSMEELELTDPDAFFAKMHPLDMNGTPSSEN